MIKLHEKFIIDENGHKTSVVLPVRDYESLLEDIHDLATIAERKHEKTISSFAMKAKLKKNGLL